MNLFQPIVVLGTATTTEHCNVTGTDDRFRSRNPNASYSTSAGQADTKPEASYQEKQR